MFRYDTRPGRAYAFSRFLTVSFLGVAALLFLLVPAASLAAADRQAVGLAATPPVRMPAAVEGFVTAWDPATKIARLAGSNLLDVDLSSARIVRADADPSDSAVPPIGPGAHLAATVEAPDVTITIYPPPPLKAINAAVRPAGSAFLHGEIEGVGAESFSILHRVIQVDSRTVFGGESGGQPIDSLSDLKAGMKAEVWVVPSGGLLVALKVLAHGPGVTPRPVAFRGVVTDISADGKTWTIDGKSVSVTVDTKIVGDPKVGDTVDVLATDVSGMLTALMIAKFTAPPPPVPGRTVTFKGVVQATPPSGALGFWKIADRHVMVNGLTRLEGDPKTGDTVEVTGYAVPSMNTVPSPAGAANMVVLATKIVKY